MAKNIVKLTPLITVPGIYCHLLQLNDTKILVNCGTNEFMNTDLYKNILPIIMECDVILITGFGIECLGALPFIMNNNYYKPIYMTLPCKILGNIVLEEYMNTCKTFYNFDMKRPNNILDNTDIIVDIKYMQPFNIRDIAICAYNAGYSLGSALYKISVGVQNIFIGYNLNHRKENLLDGVDLNKIKEPFLFVTNSCYVYREDISCKVRDEDIKKFIEKYISKKMKIIFFVDYQRILELLLILNTIKNTKIVCLAVFIKNFIERAKSMIEWTGSKTLETFHKEKCNPFEFDNIDFVEYYSKMKDFDVCVVIDEDVLSPVTSSLLNKYNNENTVLVFFNLDKEDKLIKESLEKKVYNFSGKYVEQVAEVHSELSVEIEQDLDSSEEKEQDWSAFSYEIWRGVPVLISKDYENPLQTEDSVYEMIYGKVETKEEEESFVEIVENINEEILFPPVKSFRNYDNYGEYIDREKFKMKRLLVEEVKPEVKQLEKLYVEDKKLISSGFQLKCLTTTLNFSGTCDLNSIKMILQGSETEKIVIIPTDDESSKLFYYSLLYFLTNTRHFICNTSINLSADTSVSIVNLSTDFLKIDYKNIEDDKIAQFEGKKVGNKIEYIKKPNDIMVANLDVNELKKKLIKNNLKVEADGNILTVEKTIFIIINGDEIVLEGEHSDFFYYIRHLIYQNIAII